MKNQTKRKSYSEVAVKENARNENHLVLFNDEVNSFDFVIDSLIDVCNLERVQAEQCTYIIHYNGKYSVREGAFRKLKPMCEALLGRGLTASVE